MPKFLVLAAFVNLVEGTRLFTPRGPEAGKRLVKGDRVSPPGEFESEDEAQILRLVRARCLASSDASGAALIAAADLPPAVVQPPASVALPGVSHAATGEPVLDKDVRPETTEREPVLDPATASPPHEDPDAVSPPLDEDEAASSPPNEDADAVSPPVIEGHASRGSGDGDAQAVADETGGAIAPEGGSAQVAGSDGRDPGGRSQPNGGGRKNRRKGSGPK